MKKQTKKRQPDDPLTRYAKKVIKKQPKVIAIRQTIPKPETADDVLAIIREFLNRPYQFPEGHQVKYDEARNLWDVLTALRGPDNASHQMKEATTAVIRRHVVGVIGHAMCMQDSYKSAQYRKQMCPSHFVTHAERAFVALGLDWDKVNKLKEGQ